MTKLKIRALSLRQPWAELVIQGKKSIEVRRKPTRIRGLLQVYAAKSRDIDPNDLDHVRRTYDLDIDALPRGLLVGTVRIVDCRK